MRFPLMRRGYQLQQEHSNVGRYRAGLWSWALRRGCWLYLCVRSALIRRGACRRSSRVSQRNTAMMFDYTLAGLVSAGLLFYLTYALLRPERF
jgi:K+-transporting ATPase KdpF subunit